MNKKLWNTKKLKKNKEKYLRFVIQVFFFFWAPAAFTSAFSGFKYVFTKMGMAKEVEITSFLVALFGLCAFTMVFGRFFCGFACSFGSLGDWIYSISSSLQKKRKKKGSKGKAFRIPLRIRESLDYLKYLILFLVGLLCFTGFFQEVFSQSPWFVFSLLTAKNFDLAGYGVGVLLLVLTIVGMAVQERFFCRFLCPMGAIFSLLPILRHFSYFRSKNSCLKGCKACETVCPADLKLPDDGGEPVSDHCFQCQKCISVCPKGNDHTGFSFLRGNEWWWTLARTGLLILVFWAIGI